jgi:uncharacterized protein YjbI with pentapeptide repeats
MINELLERLTARRQTISILWQQLAAQTAAYALPSTIYSIYEAADDIAHIKAQIRAKNKEVDDQPDDQADQLRIKLQGHIPNQNRPAPKYYISRGKIEESLVVTLSDEHAEKLVVVHGFSGMGKTSTVAYVIEQVREQYSSGIFWGDLADYTPDDLFLSFLESYQNGHHNHSSRYANSSRDRFWKLADEYRSQILVVFDNVSSPEQVQRILPAHAGQGKYRILIISFRPFETIAKQVTGEQAELLKHCARVALPSFTEEEIKVLFEKRLGAEKYQHYYKELLEISQRVEMRPHMVAAYAGEIAENRGSPAQYALKLRAGEAEFSQFASAAYSALEVLLAHLSEDERDIFELTSVMGKGQWPIAMMAAVCLHPVSVVREALQNLARRNLVNIVDTDRYTTNAIIREYAEQRFMQRPIFFRHAAYQLLARHCLDLAQKLDGEMPETLGALTPASVKLFQNRVLPARVHIQRVLDWATRHEQWDVLLRFARVAQLELHEHLRANSFEVRKTANLATFLAPIVRNAGEMRAARVRAHAPGPGWQIQPNQGEKYLLTDRSHDTWVEFRADGAPDTKDLRCELNTQLSACVITDGVFDTMCLVDSQWAGVRAPSIIFRHVDVVGCRFLACDFRDSIWAHCDARRVILQHSNMRNTLLRHVKLHGADLRGADFTGALLEDVDLRGADLRDANFTCARLDSVDLRGALLENTNFTAMEHRELKIEGTRIDQSIWAGVNSHTIALSDPTVIEIFLDLSNKAVPVPLPPHSASLRALDEIAKLIVRPTRGEAYAEVSSNYSENDLRAIDIAERQFSPQHILRAADLRAANLSKALLNSVVFNNAQLRAADMSETQLVNARLYGANLSAANLHKANCSGAFLETAMLRGAYLARANFSEANLKAAQLQSAELYGANFESTVLEGANLSYVQANGLSATSFREANLSGAILDEGDFGGADFTGANLSGASCINTNFQGATISPSQLAQAARLDGATLPDGIVAQVFAGEYNAASEWPANLQFAHFDGVLANVQFGGRDLSGVHLKGRSRRGMFVDCDFSHARLGGSFRSDDFRGCTWAGARLSGTFSQVQFGAADFSTASFAGATLVNVDLSAATGLSDEQLRLAYSLHRVMLPGGIYNGRFNLSGDCAGAQAAGIDLNDPEAMARFLADPHPRYLQT